MELLTIKHEDFDLIIECGKYEDIWRKANRNIAEDCLMSTYSWTDGVESVEQTTAEGESLILQRGEKSPAIFFDNADYPIWVEFKQGVTSAQFGSLLQSESDKFTFRRHILTGFINYGNEIGKSEIELVYAIRGQQKRFTFTFEVLSTKLNYHEHWRSIIEDIEKEYRMLSLDYMKRTFHGFTPDSESETPEIVWWSVFQSEQEKFVKAVKNIIDRPRRRLQGSLAYKRADQLRRVPTTLENEIAEHRREEAHLYRIEEHIQTHDTQENRFLKFALAQITARYDRLHSRIKDLKNVSEDVQNKMQLMANTLHHLARNPFFRTVGRYKGMQQESMVLHKAAGYSQVYRTWNLLRRGYSLQDGLYRLQAKDIATLYEIWCFIEMSHIVKEQLQLEDADVDHRNRMEMNGVFTWELGKGEHSRILFRKDGVELAELVYNPKSTETENSNVGVKDLVVRTVPQKPDILLQLTKNDMQEDMKMTYLFDAKYRIDSRKDGVDIPPEDAINQMHRYRDAIYYKEHRDGSLKKEVIGGYILFPGDGDKVDVEVSNFYKSIAEVNIGAFPLRPKDEKNRSLLEDFVKTLIASPSHTIVENVIPQKGAFVEVGNRVLIGVLPENNPSLLEKFRNGVGTLYYTRPQFPTTIALHNLHFFIPYEKGKGAKDVYEIVKVRTTTTKDVKPIAEEENDPLRLAFELKFHHKLSEHPLKIRPDKKFISYTFIDTTFEQLDEYLAEETILNDNYEN